MEAIYENGVICRYPYAEIENEKWKDIFEFDGYQISDFGRVRCCRNNRGGLTSTYRIIKPSVDKDGHFYVDMSKFSDIPKKQYHKRVNILVATYFIGPSPYPNMVVDHKDGNKQNNKVDNLQWITSGENSTLAAKAGLYKPKPVRIKETGEIFRSIQECADTIKAKPSNISNCLSKGYRSVKDMHFEYVTMDEYNNFKNRNAKTKDFLYPHQQQAIKRMFSGCILNGGVGSGKSRTALYWYFSKNGGKIENQKYIPMRQNPPDLYIITTAKKKHDKEWEGELTPFLLYPDPDTKRTEQYGNKVVIDSWNVIKKYTDVTGAVFLFDEDKVCGKGAWAKAFLKIAKNNEWVILSASPGDVWQDYETVFIANGFFRNRTEFRDEHLIYSRFAKYPDVVGYRNETRLIRLRNKILIDMDFKRHTIPHHEDIYVNYDIPLYRQVIRSRFDPYKQEPIEQASGLCYVLRKIVNTDDSRQVKLLEIFEDHPRMIVFYSFDYERDILLNLAYGEKVSVAEYSGHAHEAIPKTDRWVYLVNYSAGAEGFNCITTNCIVFYSQTYSYKTLLQATGRIDRLNTPYDDLYYYHLKSRSPIDLAIGKALKEKKNFNERRFTGWK